MIYPPRNYHILRGEKENHLQKCLGIGYVNFQEGASNPTLVLPCFSLKIIPTWSVKLFKGALVATRPLKPLFFKVAFWVGEMEPSFLQGTIKVGPIGGEKSWRRGTSDLKGPRSANYFNVGQILSRQKYMFKLFTPIRHPVAHLFQMGW